MVTVLYNFSDKRSPGSEQSVVRTRSRGTIPPPHEWFCVLENKGLLIKRALCMLLSSSGLAYTPPAGERGGTARGRCRGGRAALGRARRGCPRRTPPGDAGSPGEPAPAPSAFWAVTARLGACSLRGGGGRAVGFVAVSFRCGALREPLRPPRPAKAAPARHAAPWLPSPPTSPRPGPGRAAPAGPAGRARPAALAPEPLPQEKPGGSRGPAASAAGGALNSAISVDLNDISFEPFYCGANLEADETVNCWWKRRQLCALPSRCLAVLVKDW